MFAKWVHIDNLYSVSKILSPDIVREVVTTEKIDGTSVRIGVIKGVLRVGGRNKEFDIEKDADKSGFGFMGWVREHPELQNRLLELAVELGKNIVVYGEWFGEKIQRRIIYLPNGQRSLRIFGVRLNEAIVDWDILVDISSRIGLSLVPVLYRGAPDLKIFDRLRDLPSRTAAEHGIIPKNNLAEGIVIFPIPMRKIDREWLIAKYKRPEFAERRSERESRTPKLISAEEAIAVAAAQDVAQTFVQEFWTLERLRHVLSYIQEFDPNLEIRFPKVVGLLIKRMFKDVIEEGQPEWQMLSEEAKRIVGKLHPKATKSLLEDSIQEVS